MYLLDTNACIAILNQRSSTLISTLRSKRADEILLCSIVKAELAYGAHRSQYPEKNLQTLGLFFSQFDSIPFDDRAVDAYGRIRAELSKRGQLIGPMDLMIAAIAFAHDLTLITRNVREFERIAGLKIENWHDL